MPKKINGYQTIQVEVSNQRIVDLFIGACEGGSNYWCKKVTPYGKGDAYEAMLAGFECVELENGKTHKVNPVDITKALHLMAKDWVWHFADFISEKDDAETADVLLQLCVFGDLIYG